MGSSKISGHRTVRAALAIGLASASFLLLGAPSAVPGPGDRPDLTGDWQLDPSRSDVAMRSGNTGVRRGPGGGPGGGGGGGGRPPGGARPPGAGGGFGGALMEDRGVQELLRAKATLVIEQDDSTVTLRDDSGWTRELRPGGGKIREELAQGGPAEVESRWKGDRLVTVRRLDRGAELTERLARDRKTGDLILEVEFKMARMPRAMELKRIYVMADSAP